MPPEASGQTAELQAPAKEAPASKSFVGIIYPPPEVRSKLNCSKKVLM